CARPPMRDYDGFW
nr:immunoglobulin heavy chain junction region [Mus musculus]